MEKKKISFSIRKLYSAFKAEEEFFISFLNFQNIYGYD